jgi:hypothetical protein
VDIEIRTIGVWGETRVECGYAGPGRLEDHAIAIWDVSNPAVPILSRTIRASDDDSLPSFPEIFSFRLNAGHRYVIAARYENLDPQLAFDNPLNSFYPETPGVDFIGARYGLGSSSLEFPATFVGGAGFIGPAFSYDVVTPSLNRAPVLTLPAAQEVLEGTLLSVTASATDPDAGDTLTFSLIAPPAGATINASTGVISWTPTTDQKGVFTITVQVADNASPPQTDTQSFKVIVGNNRSPDLQFRYETAAAGLNEGSPFVAQVSASDLNLSDVLTFSLVSPPPGASIDAATGTVSWIPSYDQGPGFYVITVRVTDNGSPPLSATRSARVQVNNVNRPPVLTVPADQTVNEGSTLNVNASAVDPDGDMVSYSLIGDPPCGRPPAGMTVNPSTGAISWTPIEAHGPGVYTIAVRAVDNGSPSASDVKTFTVTVNEVNNPQIQRYSVRVILLDPNGVSGPVNWTGTATPSLNPPGWQSAFVTAELQTQQVGWVGGGSLFLRHAGLWSGTVESFVDLNPWTASFRDPRDPSVIPIYASIVRGTIGTMQAGSVEAWILDPGEGPCASLWDTSIWHAGIWEGTRESWLDLHDFLPAAALRSNATGISTDNGKILVVGDFVLPGMPEQDGTVMWELTPLAQVNTGPTLTVPPDQTVDEGTLLSASASATDPDPEDTLTFSLLQPPAGATIDPATGAISWTPAEAQGPGVYTIQVWVTDDGVPPAKDTKSFQVTVRKVNDTPVANPDSLARKAGQGTKVLASRLTLNDADADGDPLTVLSVISPTAQGGTVTLADGWIFYQPPSGSDPVLDSFTYTVRDTDAATANGTVTISIAPPGTDPTLNILGVSGGFPNPAIVRFAGIPGRVYTVQSSPSLITPVWKTLGTATVQANGLAQFTDNEAATQPVLFYRALQQ